MKLPSLISSWTHSLVFPPNLQCVGVDLTTGNQLSPRRHTCTIWQCGMSCAYEPVPGGGLGSGKEFSTLSPSNI